MHLSNLQCFCSTECKYYNIKHKKKVFTRYEDPRVKIQSVLKQSNYMNMKQPR